MEVQKNAKDIARLDRIFDICQKKNLGINRTLVRVQEVLDKGEDIDGFLDKLEKDPEQMNL